MIPTLTADQLARLEAAFALWDTTENGTIHASSLGDVMRHVGRTLPTPLASLYPGPRESDTRIGFDEFLDIVSAVYAYRDEMDVWADLLMAFTEYDDDESGYIPLWDIMLALDTYLKGDSAMDVHRNRSDDQLVTIYRKALDVGMLEDASANMAPEEMWNLVAQELKELRREQTMQNNDAALVWYAFGMTGTRCQPSEQDGRGRLGHDAAGPDHVLNVAVVNFSGESMMSLTIVHSSLVQELKQQIQKATGLPARRQLLAVEGQVLCHDECTLLEAGLWDGASITLAIKKELKVDYVKFAEELMNFL